MEEHDAEDEIQAEEHGQRQHDVERHRLGGEGARAQDVGAPFDLHVAGHGVHEADDHFGEHLSKSAPSDGDAPVLNAVVDGKKLKRRKC